MKYKIKWTSRSKWTGKAAKDGTTGYEPSEYSSKDQAEKVCKDLDKEFTSMVHEVVESS